MLWQAAVVFTALILADPCPAVELTLAGEVQVLAAVIFRSETRTTSAWKDYVFLVPQGVKHLTLCGRLKSFGRFRQQGHPPFLTCAHEWSSKNPCRNLRAL